MLRTVAIVGSHTRTRPDVPWGKDGIDFWVFNESASIGWPKKVDAVFQMHAEPVWKNPLNRNDPNFPQWMKKEHPFPVWMLDEYDGVPASVSYPLDEICGHYLGQLYKGKSRVRYFTSTVAYAIALAIHEGYERIELYGVEMESDTEYRLQRDGVFFWIGVALGQGVQVYIPERANLFREPLYGYEGGAYLGREQLLKRKEILEARQPQAVERVDMANGRQAAIIDVAIEESGGEPGMAATKTIKEYLLSIKEQTEAVVEAGMFAGALSEVARYLEKCDRMDEESGSHLLARQEFELTAAQADKLAVQRKTHLDVLGGEARKAWNDLSAAIVQDGDFPELDKLSEVYAKAHQAYITAAFEWGTMQGIIRENMTLLMAVDELVTAAGGEKAEEALMLDALNARLAGKEVADVRA